MGENSSGDHSSQNAIEKLNLLDEEFEDDEETEW